MAKKKKTTKGVFQPGKPIKEKAHIALPVSLPERKSVRYRCARIMNGSWDVKDGLKKQIEKQFKKGMDWDNFMKVWDVDQDDPYKVIKKPEE